MIKLVAFDFYGVFVRNQVEEAREALANSAQAGAFETMLHGYFTGQATLLDVNKVLKQAGTDLHITHNGSKDLNHALLALVQSLKSHNIKSAVVGNLGLEDANWIWQHNIGGSVFDYLVPSVEMAELMPTKKFFETLSKRSDIPLSATAYVATEQEGADAAAQAGAIGVRFSSTDRLTEVLAKLVATS
jgi:FMN phosphatase YigB (HAD superfamily)